MIMVDKIVIISKSVRSSYKYCFPYCLFCEKKMLFNFVLYFTFSIVFKESVNLFQFWVPDMNDLFARYWVF